MPNTSPQPRTPRRVQRFLFWIAQAQSPRELEQLQADINADFNLRLFDAGAWLLLEAAINNKQRTMDN